MAEYKNIILKNTVSALPYKSKSGGGNRNNYPSRDKYAHASRILDCLKSSFDNDKSQKASAVRHKSGMYLEFSSSPGYELQTKSLDNRHEGIALLNISVDEGTKTTRATVYIPNGKESFFLKRVEDYQMEFTKSNKPKNESLVASIDDVRLAVLNSFWIGEKSDIPKKDKKWCEIWLRVPFCKEKSHFEEVESNLNGICEELGIKISQDKIEFPERLVKLILVSEEDLKRLIYRCDYIAEIRLASEPTSFFVDMQTKDQVEWIEDLLKRTDFKLDGTTICLLDTGLDSKQKLLEKATNDDHIQSVKPNWNPFDHDGHGTEMAGVALYDDLKKHLVGRNKLHISHEIESVKLLPPKGKNPVELYGCLTKNAVSMAEIANPKANRIICMAITERNNLIKDGSPSSWSGAIDDIASGANEENVKRLIIISAGNVEIQEISKLGYPDANCTHSVESPGQAWNAITVGAYSGVVEIDDAKLRGFQALRKSGDLSPYSSTSKMWEKRWPVKPEVLFMGGNVAHNGHDYDSCDDLSLLTTGRGINNKYRLTSIWATSAATAQAAWFAAQIASEYPNLWPETIRALMIHSADWTTDMKDCFCKEDKKTTGRRILLRTCGYGIPDLKKALHCLKNSVNMIIEGELQPFSKDKMNEMNIHKIPWPKELLLSLGNTPVTLRVTLSYFIEPGPGEVGWKDKYRYASCGLRFDVNKTNENLSEFEKRINIQMREDDKDYVDGSSDSNRWYLGPQNRDVGSIHSDMMLNISASELCDCYYIAVYPVVGWWRERGYLGKSEKKQRYSLVVSLSTPNVSVDFYTAIQMKIGNVVSIPV